MIDAAILGLGWWGQALVRAVQGKSDRIRFTKAMVPDPAKRAAVADELGLALCSRYDEVLADPAIDAVVVATPHSLHVEQVVAAARAGKAVFCEKPLALTREGAEQCVAACADAGVVLAIGHNRRFMPAVAYLQDAIRRGVLGRVLYLEAHSSNESARNNFAAWRSESAESPAGGMTGTGIHLLDLAVSLLGRPANVFCRVSTAGVKAPPEDACNALLTFANGVSATLSMVQTSPRYWRMHVFGSKGSLEILNDEEMILHRSGRQPALRSRLAAVDALRIELDAFAKAIDTERPYAIAPEEMVWTAATMEAVCRSLSSGREETV